MSGKKTAETVAEVREDDKPQLSNEEKMEAGKIEVLKVVDGVAGADKLGDLIERGKKKGNLSASELMDVLENMDLESDQMDKIYDTLENLGIDTVGDDYLPELADPDGPPVSELEDIPEDDGPTFEMIGQGRTSGVFQMESSGMTGVCVGMKPRSIEDITAIIALYRPGPMDSIPRFIACKQNPRRIS